MTTEEGAPEEERPPERFFVTIKPSARRQVRELSTLDLDLHVTREEPEGMGVDGLLTLEEVAKVVRSGCPVLVTADARDRAGARNVIEFDEWLEAHTRDLGHIGER